MNEDRIEGAGKEFSGKIKEGVGKLSGDEKLQAEGEIDQVKGKAQNLVGKARDGAADAAEVVSEKASQGKWWARDIIEHRPFTSVIVMFSLGLFAGLMSFSSR
jgi:uncharacterized protein YjbJ (UPF0337 family)